MTELISDSNMIMEYMGLSGYCKLNMECPIEKSVSVHIQIIDIDCERENLVINGNEYCGNKTIPILNLPDNKVEITFAELDRRDPVDGYGFKLQLGCIGKLQ